MHLCLSRTWRGGLIKGVGLVKMNRKVWTKFIKTVPASGKLKPDQAMYHNNRYVVIVERQQATDGQGPDLVSLSIRDRERSSRHDWRDMQRIKNELIGPEIEMVEIYPAESRLVDTSNHYFLWGLDDPTFRFPFGFGSRLVAEGPYSNGAVQRPFTDKPGDLVSPQDLEKMAASLSIE